MGNETNILRLSEEFLSACNMFQVQPIEALQFYICKLTIYSNLVNTQGVAYSLAKKIFEESYQKNCSESKMDEYKRLTGIKYVREIVRLTMTKEKTEKKEEKYKNLINKWYNDLQRNLPSDTLKISSELSIPITRDFYILCEVFRISPIEALQYYVNHVSIVKYIKSSKENPFVCATVFFLQYPPISKQINAS